jgi:hypothetical protein
MNVFPCNFVFNLITCHVSSYKYLYKHIHKYIFTFNTENGCHKQTGFKGWSLCPNVCNILYNKNFPRATTFFDMFTVYGLPPYKTSHGLILCFIVVTIKETQMACRFHTASILFYNSQKTETLLNTACFLKMYQYTTVLSPMQSVSGVALNTEVCTATMLVLLMVVY